MRIKLSESYEKRQMTNADCEHSFHMEFNPRIAFSMYIVSRLLSWRRFYHLKKFYFNFEFDDMENPHFHLHAI